MHNYLSNRSTRAQILFWAFMQLPAFAVLEILFRIERPYDPSFVHFDVQIYYNAAKAALAGQVPYRDFFFPYPPASLLFFIPPALVSTTDIQFFRIFEIWVLLLDWGILAAVVFVALKLGQSLHRTLLLYTLAVPAMGVIVWQRYDLIPAFIVVVSIAAWVKGWRAAAWSFLALGTLVKIYPVLLAPLFVMDEYRARGPRSAVRGFVVFIALVAIGFAPFFVASFDETWQTFFAQGARGFEIESVGATLMMAASWLGFPAQAAYRRRLNTWEADSPASSVLQLVFMGLEIAATLFVYWRFWRNRQADVFELVRYSTALLALSMLTSKVFSAQFIIWLFPLALLSGKEFFVRTGILFLIASMLTQIGFPFGWQDLKLAAPLPTIALILRDAALALMTAILLGARRAVIPQQMEISG
jgi:hypothetical protein